MSDTASADDLLDDPDGETLEFGENAEVYEWQRHRNGDETALLLLAFAGGWQVLAVDVDGGGQVLETETVGSSPERSKAVGMAEYWLDQHPGGIMGGTEDSGGILDGLFGGG